MNDPSYYPLLRPPPSPAEAPPPDERTDAPPAEDSAPVAASR
ncbi:hypothetical protein ACFYS8_04730 [Kitasatospora sp. NPDC004615]